MCHSLRAIQIYIFFLWPNKTHWFQCNCLDACPLNQTFDLVRRCANEGTHLTHPKNVNKDVKDLPHPKNINKDVRIQLSPTRSRVVVGNDWKKKKKKKKGRWIKNARTARPWNLNPGPSQESIAETMVVAPTSQPFVGIDRLWQLSLYNFVRLCVV